MGKQIKDGLLTGNPIAIRLLGLSAALAVTTSFLNGLGMGLCVLAVLTLSNLLLSALGQYIPDRIHTISAIVVIATLSAVADLVVQALLPDLAGDLGLFLPLLAVTCILLSQAGAFPYENTVAASALEGLGQGAGYTLVLVLVSIIREFLGKGSFGSGLLGGGQGFQIFPARFAAGGMLLPVGGFLALGCVVAAVQWLASRRKKPGKRGGGKR